jgi:DNA-binding response OmpR family regulator
MKKNVLVIEDEESIREYMCYILQKNGYHVDEAKNGAEGLEHFTRGKVDLVVTDMVMPGKDGGEIMRTIRKVDPAVAMVAVSGAMSFTELVAGAAAGKGGADEVIQKPFTENEFLKTIRRCLKKSPA